MVMIWSLEFTPDHLRFIEEAGAGFHRKSHPWGSAAHVTAPSMTPGGQQWLSKYELLTQAQFRAR